MYYSNINKRKFDKKCRIETNFLSSVACVGGGRRIALQKKGFLMAHDAYVGKTLSRDFRILSNLIETLPERNYKHQSTVITILKREWKYFYDWKSR